MLLPHEGQADPVDRQSVVVCGAPGAERGGRRVVDLVARREIEVVVGEHALRRVEPVALVEREHEVLARYECCGVETF